jgi:hypothetical protein
VSVRRIQPRDPVPAEDDELRLPVDVDEHRRGRRVLEIAGTPHHRTGVLFEGGDRLPLAANRRDHRVPVRDRAARIAALGPRRPVLLDEVV